MIQIDNYMIFYYESGAVCSFSEIDETGRHNGYHVRFHVNGGRFSERTYLKGKRNGLSCAWYRSGMIQEEIMYNDSLEHGLAKLYNMDGECTYFFYYYGDNITAKIESLVKDIANITDEEKVLISLQYGIFV